MNQQTLFSATPLVHNTAHFSDGERTASKRSAESQEVRVMVLARAKGRFGVTRAECFKQLARKGEVETSFGRALTNLVKDGLLEKTKETRPGAHGKSNFIYRVL